MPKASKSQTSDQRVLNQNPVDDAGAKEGKGKTADNAAAASLKSSDVSKPIQLLSKPDSTQDKTSAAGSEVPESGTNPNNSITQLELSAVDRIAAEYRDTGRTQAIEPAIIKAFADLNFALGDRLTHGKVNGMQPTTLDSMHYCQNTRKILASMFGGTEVNLRPCLVQLDVLQAQQRLPLQTFLLSFIAAAGTEWVLGKSIEGYREDMFTQELQDQWRKSE